MFERKVKEDKEVYENSKQEAVHPVGPALPSQLDYLSAIYTELAAMRQMFEGIIVQLSAPASEPKKKGKAVADQPVEMEE